MGAACDKICGGSGDQGLDGGLPRVGAQTSSGSPPHVPAPAEPPPSVTIPAASRPSADNGKKVGHFRNSRTSVSDEKKDAPARTSLSDVKRESLAKDIRASLTGETKDLPPRGSRTSLRDGKKMSVKAMSAMDMLALMNTDDEEGRGMAEKLFDLHDTDKSGSLEKAEFKLMLEDLATHVVREYDLKYNGGADMAYNKTDIKNNMKWELDTNFDGSVDKEEFLKNVKTMMKNY